MSVLMGRIFSYHDTDLHRIDPISPARYFAKS
jgi:catalase